MCWIFLNMHFLQKLSKLKIFIIKIPKYSLFMVLNAVFITVYQFKTFQDDIPVLTVPMWLHHTVHINNKYKTALSKTILKRIRVWQLIQFNNGAVPSLVYFSKSPTHTYILSTQQYRRYSVPVRFNQKVFLKFTLRQVKTEIYWFEAYK